MKLSKSKKRPYDSSLRARTAGATRTRVLAAARTLFSKRGIDPVTIAEIAAKADVAASTIYALYKSKAGLLHALMSATLFDPRFEEARSRLLGAGDPVEAIALTARVARIIYENESIELGLLRGASAWSPALRKLEQEFEAIRLDMQLARIEALFDAGRQKPGLSFDAARRVMWMYTSRDVYRMLVTEGGWTAAAYADWLADTLVTALVAR